MKNTATRKSHCEKVARLLAGAPPPAWLISEIEWLSDGISTDRWFEKKLPTRSELRDSLIAAKQATLLLMKLCGSSIDSAFLETDKLGTSSPDTLTPAMTSSLRCRMRSANPFCRLRGSASISRRRSSPNKYRGANQSARIAQLLGQVCRAGRSDCRGRQNTRTTPHPSNRNRKG